MHPPGSGTVLVRYGELNTKSRSVQSSMLDQLCGQLSSLFAHREIPGKIERERGRVYVRTDESYVEAAAETAARSFGVVSVSPALSVPPEREAIESALAAAAAEHYDGGTYAVDARRAYDEHPFTSRDVEVFGGTAVAEGTPPIVTPEVDLDDPDYTFGVEVRREEAFVYLDRIDGPGGLPLGSQATQVALVSGGIDSPVAIYEAMRRGSPVVPVYVDLGEYGGPDHRARAIETVRRLAWHAPDRDWTVHVVPGGETIGRLVDDLDRGRMLALRRYMFRVAEYLAEDYDAQGIVTGESLGQKSSQTARNLRVTSAATELPIHRPLLTVDKTEITARAREIGTFHDSTINAGCNRIAPDHPVISGSPGRIREIEPDDLFERAREDAARAEPVGVTPERPDFELQRS